MRKNHAFTLLEVCLAITIGVLVFTFAIPSVQGYFAEQKLRKSFDLFDDLVGQAHRLSVLERRSYLLSWDKSGIVLRPEYPLNKAEVTGTAMIETGQDESYAAEFPAALEENPPQEWVFWPSGNCEPARITYQGKAGRWTARYDPLTARVTEFQNDLR